MGQIITQYSRVKHHTLTNEITSPPASPEIAFTVPLTEDFTVKGAWSITDLAVSEFGILEGSSELFIRIGDEIKQVPLQDSTSGNVASGTSSFIGGGKDNFADGNYSAVAGGLENEAIGDFSSISGGYSAIADKYGQRSYAAGPFGITDGSAQQVDFVLRNSTTDATPTNVFLDGLAERLTITTGTSLSCIINITGIEDDGKEAAHYLRKIMIKNVAGTTSLVGSVRVISTDTETTASMDVTITADNTNDALDIKVTGLIGTAMNWVCHVTGIEIAYAA